MPDREKVITWLEICGERGDCSGCCPYLIPRNREDCRENLMIDALELLRKQKPKNISVTYQNENCKDGKCPSCGQLLSTTLYPKFCGFCGQAVKWQ